MKTKVILLLLFSLLCSYNIFSQNYVHIVRCDSIPEKSQALFALSTDRLLPEIGTIKSVNGKLEFIPPTKDEVAEIRKGKYYISISSFEDTIQVIKELLDLEGDNRTLCIPVTSHSPKSSSLYFLNERKWVSVEVYALYIIWGLFFDYEYNAAYPVLVADPLRGKQVILKAISGKTSIEKAFISYRKWLKRGKGKLNRLKEKDPLKDSGISWLH